MPKKEVVVSHVYDVHFQLNTARQFSPQELIELKNLFTAELNGYLLDRLSEAMLVPVDSVIKLENEVDVYEMCYEQGPAGPCVRGEGHRGTHEDANTNRWGHDL